jgi:hypothetical protein
VASDLHAEALLFSPDGIFHRSRLRSSQIIYEVPFDGSVSPLFADLDFAQVFDRLIVGPTQYPWPIYGAFVEVLKAAGVPSAEERVFVSKIPIRS